jgi:hypothetical protein
MKTVDDRLPFFPYFTIDIPAVINSDMGNDSLNSLGKTEVVYFCRQGEQFFNRTLNNSTHISQVMLDIPLKKKTLDVRYIISHTRTSGAEWNNCYLHESHDFLLWSIEYQ